MSQITAILWVEPLLPSQQESCQERWGLEAGGPSGRARGLKRQPSGNSVYAGSQRWSLLGDSRLGALGAMATGVPVCGDGQPDRLLAQCKPQRPTWKWWTLPSPQTAFERDHWL